MHKIKWFTQNLKRRKFHSTSTEDGFVVKDHYMMIIVSSGKDEKEAQKGLDLFQQYQ